MAPQDNGSRGVSTRLLHADSAVANTPAISPSISVSTTFRHPRPDAPKSQFDPSDPDHDIYSRYTQPNLTRAEKVLGSLLNGHAVAYGSGLSAIFAALLHYRPDVIAIPKGEGYHGAHETIAVYQEIRGSETKLIGLDADYTGHKNLICWLETPLNPTGEARDIQHYADKVHKAGGHLVVDSTFGPPPLQDPFEFGADMVMHSGTKYFGGHSDALLGVLAVKDMKDWTKLWTKRTFVGTLPGSLEAWLLLRSLRTLDLRVRRQSATATALALWFSQIISNASTPGSSFDNCPGGLLAKVHHASLQGLDGVGGAFNPLGEARGDTGDGLKKRAPQMKGGPACFAIVLGKEEWARWLPHETKLFQPATSLGGVESLMEQRLVSDPNADGRVVRLSVGLEDLEDLKEDVRQAFRAILKRQKESKL